MDLTWLPLVGHSLAESPWWLKPVFFAIWVCLASFSVARHFFLVVILLMLFLLSSVFYHLLLFRNLQTVETNSGHTVSTYVPHVQIKITPLFLFTTPWSKGRILISCIWVGFLLEYDHPCSLKNLTTVCQQTVVHLSDGNDGNRKDYFFFTVLWPL